MFGELSTGEPRYFAGMGSETQTNNEAKIRRAGHKIKIFNM